MKALTWSLAAFVALLALELARYTHDGWAWVWIALLGFWIFAGVVMGLVALAKLVTGRVGAGLPGRMSLPSKAAPAPHKEE